jgi:hypothetical protein
MFLPLIEQFGMKVDMLIKPDPKFLLDLEQRAYNVYYVPEAFGNPYIPAQKGFIVPYRIRSIWARRLCLQEICSQFHVLRGAGFPEVADLFRTISSKLRYAFEKAVFT